MSRPRKARSVSVREINDDAEARPTPTNASIPNYWTRPFGDYLAQLQTSRPREWSSFVKILCNYFHEAGASDYAGWVGGGQGFEDPPLAIEAAALSAIIRGFERIRGYTFPDPQLKPDQVQKLDELRGQSFRAIQERLRKMDDDDVAKAPGAKFPVLPADTTKVSSERALLPNYVMKSILPALWSTPPGLSDEGNAVFAAIRNALRWASEILRQYHLPRFCENDFYPYYRRIPDDLSPLWGIADRHWIVPAETWDCAWAVREAVWPIFKELQYLFMDAEFPWEGTEPLPNLEYARKRILDLRKTFAEEALMRDLCKSIAKEYSAIGMEGQTHHGEPRLAFDQPTWTITLDGVPESLKPKAFLIYKAIFENPHVTRQKLRAGISGIKGDKTIPKILATLPETLRKTVNSDNSGYWITLPTLPTKKSAKSGK